MSWWPRTRIWTASRARPTYTNDHRVAPLRPKAIAATKGTSEQAKPILTTNPATAAWVGLGANIFYNTAVLNEYRTRIGAYSSTTTLPQLRTFLESGGTVLTIGSSTSLGQHLGLPIGNKLVDASGSPLAGEQYYVPGSVLRVTVDTAHPLAHGLRPSTDVYFDNSPVFTLPADAQARGLTPIAWFDSAAPLRSGWAWGQQYLQGGVAVAEARVGKGTLVLFGPEITFRAQPHGTFKFLFNGIYRQPGTGNGQPGR